MPPRKQPPTLRFIALRAATGALNYQVRVVMSMSAQRHECRLQWLCDSVRAVPEPMSGALVTAALQCADVFLSYRNNHPARRVLDKLLTALLPDTTRRVALPVAESYPLREALLRRVQALPLLRELTLAESLPMHTNPDLAVSVLCHLHQLVVVRAPWLCSDAMAVTLAQHCPHLEALDAFESGKKLTDRGVAALAKGCPRLRTLLLTGCCVSQRGFELLLSRLPSLQRVGRCSSLGAVVRAVAPGQSAARLALTEWDSDHAPDATEAALCPAVRTVLLNDVAVVPADDGAPLPPAVERLRVSWVGLRDHASRLTLRLTPGLTHLEMMDVSMADAVEVGRQCPSLRVLKLAVHGYSGGSAATPLRPSREAPFRRLEEFYLYSGPGPLLEYVLLHATALTKVSVTPGLPVDSVPPWTDALMRRIVGVNPLAELTSFSLACPCDLTMDTVYLLLLGCPKLHALFDLHEWNVSDTQKCELQELIATNNWDLELGLGHL